ncbi:MAG: gamma-glutamylcyclotransferase [Hydrogenophaga sp.]|uniref:gamma-glutamylcyclotransferase n=1 Tax=Hydrogenophaga sp. TaxID=1904254 RepID=UPI0027305709|nr:gamma-glutamylcyclotransferase [Hydrogenophaga sp.]MDP2163383.1 gamma-glutamylcyclotransferase [Hydrogenophaga sp.]
MSGQPFRHLPALAGQIRSAAESRLRATDEVLAAWDAEAHQRGLGPCWRWSNAALDVSRRAVMAHHDGTQDLWIFAYGSLMWDPALHFTEVRRATLTGYQRRFSCKTTIGRGTVDQPGLVVALEPQGGACEGLVFRIDASLADQESQLFWRREMILGSYQPRFLQATTPQGSVRALALLSNPDHASHAAHLNLQETAAIIGRACGSHGTNLEYLRQLAVQLGRLGINDDYVRGLLHQIVDKPLPDPDRFRVPGQPVS